MVGTNAVGQQVNPQQEQRLLQMSDSLQRTAAKEKEDAVIWATKNQLSVRFKTGDGGEQELQYVNEAGLPVYYRTFNRGAATTTRANALYEGGTLNLSLSGKGMKVGVWDGGGVKDHKELKGRFQQLDGSSEMSNHATHVTGTIIASGQNSSAKGMAFEADAITNDWNSDLAEMASQASKGLLLSNHSYGLVLGWGRDDSGNWTWYGGDADEDYRFGFYSGKSQALDKMAADAPYYTIVWAAGNDRTDTGDGTKPVDGPFDTIGPEGVAKNIITVGAVEKVSEYAGASSIKMANFSSWGPTDDGRIKPDIVGAGVGIFSPIATGDDQYASYNGTSMAAPNVSGSLLLLQQLYQQLYGSYMRAATLKGLAIHTAREAGAHNGPDYQHGWGLLDTQTAASAILNNISGKSYIIQELELSQGETIEIPVNSDGQGPLRATICWTDVPGSPSGASIDPKEIKLVNDLDLRIRNNAGTAYSPWILDPANPNKAAAKGDNIRDNVEVVELKSPEARDYIVSVAHKGNLSGGKQLFSIILEYSGNQSVNRTLYWVGGSGSWHDGGHWSLNSGGTPANEVPTHDDNAVFDENSFTEGSAQVEITEPAAAASLRWYNQQDAKLVFADEVLSLSSSAIINSSNLVVEGRGMMQFVGDDPFGQLSLGEVNMPSIDLIFNNPEGVWKINGLKSVNSIHLMDGILTGQNKDISIGRLTIEAGADGVAFDNAKLRNLQEVKWVEGAAQVALSSAELRFKAQDGKMLLLDVPQATELSYVEMEGDGSLVVAHQLQLSKLLDNGTVDFHADATIKELVLKEGAGLFLQEGVTLTVTSNMEALGTSGNPISLIRIGEVQASIEMDSYRKICGDYLIIEGIDIIGKATLNAGKNSQVSNASNWQLKDCDDVLFADFSVDYTCQHALSLFNNTSTGSVQEFRWLINGEEYDAFDDYDATFSFPEVGTYKIKLIISDGEFTSENEKEITIQENSLRKPEIVINDDVLAATTPSDRYQWFRDGQPIEDATGRTYNTEGMPGVYQVTVLDDDCNAVSEAVTISSVLDEKIMLAKGIRIYANPVRDDLFIEQSSFAGKYDVAIYDLFGRSVIPARAYADNKIQLDVSQLQIGIYVLEMKFGSEVYTFKILKK